MFLIAIVGLAVNARAQQKLNAATEAKITALMKGMTLEEKAGQMAQVSIESLGASKGGTFTFSDKMRDAVVNYKIGSILNTGFEKIELKAGEAKTVSFKLPVKELAFIAPDLKHHVEAGEFKVQAGNQQQSFNVNATAVF